MKFSLIILLTACGLSSVLAQAPRDRRDTASIGSFLNISLRYKSDYFFMGRSDSAKLPYLTPSLGYYHKSGFFLSTGLSYLTQGESRIDLYTASAGYDYFGRRFAAGISASQYYFDNSSYSVQAEMKTFVNAYAAYDLRVFVLTADASLGLSKDADIFAGLDVSKSFYLLRDHLRVTPAAFINFGTQHYYNEYYKVRSISTGSGEEPGNGSGGSGHGGSGNGSGGDGNGSGGDGSGGNGPGPGGRVPDSGRIASATAASPGSIITITQAEIVESEKFQILDYELSLQATYRIKSFSFVASSTVFFPVNPSKVVTDKTTYEEELSTGFLWSAGIRYTIR